MVNCRHVDLTGDVPSNDSKVQHPNHPVGTNLHPSPNFLGASSPAVGPSGGQWQLALSIFNLMSETQAKRDALIFNVAMYVSWLLALGPSASQLPKLPQLAQACRHAGQWQTALSLLLMMPLGFNERSPHLSKKAFDRHLNGTWP